MPSRAWSFGSASTEIRSLIRSVACHEAGHAVAMVLRGAGVEGAYLSSDMLDGETDRGTLGWVVPRVRTKCDAFVWASGIGAELEAGLEPHEHPDEIWEIECHRRRARHGSVDAAIRSARRELREVWPAVQDVASALCDHGSLPGDEAEGIVLDAIPDWKRVRLGLCA